MPFPHLVGIVNVTPDSFSDGGACARAEDALARVRRLLRDGADVVDIGAESTRPGAAALTPEEEWSRLRDVLPEAKRIASGEGALLSLDTRHAATARRGLEAGADWINDVTGFTASAMLDAVRDAPCRLVVMHALDVPARPDHTLPADADPVEAVAAFFAARLEALEAHGVARERVILDPGVGFGKTAAQSLALTLRADALRRFGLPLLFGHSRKSFLTLFTDKPAAARDDLTLAFSAILAMQDVQFLRVHDVCGHKMLSQRISAGGQHRP